MTGSVELIFETHSLTTDNELGIATGWLGGRLSARGCELALELGKRRRVDGIDAVFTSDLARAVETARIAFSETGIPVVLDWRLRELDYGDLNGETVDVVARERVFRIEEPFPGGESYRDAVARVEELLDDLLDEHDGQRILLIGHTATRWALDHVLDGEPLERLVGEPFAWREGWEYVLGRSVASASR